MKIINKVCVIGGSGFVGHQVVLQLLAAGYSVRVPTRRRECAQHLWVLPDVEVMEADVHEGQGLSAALKDMDAVINLAGILHESGANTFQRVHVELPRRIAQTCKSQGIPRLLHMSALGADAKSRSAYQRSKAQGEAAVRAVPEVSTTIFRPSVIFGPGDSFLNQFATLLQRLPVLALACGDAKLQPVYVQDVARAFVSSLERPATFDESYALCGPQVYTLQQLVSLVADLQRLPRWIFSLGPRASYYQAWLLEKLPGKLMTRDDLYSLQANNVCSASFPSVFGFQPTALDTIAPQYLGQQALVSAFSNLRERARR